MTLWDVGAERVIGISGPDALPFTNMLTCRDLTRCALGQGKYTPLLSAEGGIINGAFSSAVGREAARRSACHVQVATAGVGTEKSRRTAVI